MTDRTVLLAKTFNIPEKNVANLLTLLQDGATIPFIARYRKEKTGGLDEVTIRDIAIKNDELLQLDKRKEYILSVIEEAGKLTDQLKSEINDCMDLARLEDIYLPFKPKRKTRASVARDNGLEPLAKIIMSQKATNIGSIAKRFVNQNVPSVSEALEGAKDIISEWVVENLGNRGRIRNSIRRKGVIRTKGDAKSTKYADYTDYSTKLSTIPSHNFLALQRAEREGVLKLAIETDADNDIRSILDRTLHNGSDSELKQLITEAVTNSYKKSLKPSITTEITNEVKDRSDRESISLFSESLRQVLMAPPLQPTPVLAVDPGFRTGCKVVCLDSNGHLLAHDVIYPVPPVNRVAEAEAKVKRLLKRYSIKTIALGDGTASIETEEFLNSINLGSDVKIERVSEQGASIYSASETARREFPDLDLTFRSAVSIGRRLQDPLAELVKIDPKSIGVGQYQHDVNQTWLREALDFTVMRCVNEVGVNIDTASVELLTYVSGIGKVIAENIVKYRNENGCFHSRNDLLKVPRLGQKAFQQSSGFIRVPHSANPLDNSAVHPEGYPIVKAMARKLNTEIGNLIGNEKLLSQINPSDFITPDAGIETITDIINELKKPSRDPRQAQQDQWRDASLKSIDDLKVGMILKGKIVNMTAFGAFVDLGIKTNGLIHISKISSKRIANPMEALKLLQIVDVKVIGVDKERNRISLSIKDL